MSETMLLVPILLPAAAGVLVLLMRRPNLAREGLAVLATLANLVLAAVLYNKDILDRGMKYAFPWVGMGLEFALRLYQFSGFILLATAAFAFGVALYSWKFMRERATANQFYCYLLITLAMVNGAVLADHLVLLLFFWEGLLLTLFGMVAIGSPGAFRTATKAFIIVGIADVCMMFGVALTGWTAGTLVISKIHLPITAMGGLAMVFLVIGAISKAGSMPFHSWIPDAAIDAPLPFMAFLPASLEKLLGIYMLARITLDLFPMSPESWMSPLLMIVGAVTILLAVMMALVQKDYKRLLAYHAISQVGYMILGVGTAVPAGIVGGLFHMLNNSMYKCCLYLTGGAVEKQAGTTDLTKLGGLAGKMPITWGCYLIAALSISGVPPFNGFFSKELIYDATLERNFVFYLAALLGSFFTAASFLKLGHAAFLGKRDPRHDGVREAPPSMLLPMVVIAGACILFGVYNALPLNYLIQPVLGEGRLEGHSFAGMPGNPMLVLLTVAALGGALLNHLYGAKTTGTGLHAVDHIHHAPVLAGIYDRAERRVFDPYDMGLKLAGGVARLAWWADRGIDWLYDSFTVGAANTLGAGVRLAHSGNYALYVVWSLAGALAVIVFLMRSV